MIQLVPATYAIYYGWLIADAAGTPGPAAAAIAAAHPDILIGFVDTFEPRYANFSRQVRDLLREAQVTFFAYVDTDYGARPLAAVEAEASSCLARGVDGIFFDRAYNFLDDQQSAYYRRLYALVHSSGRAVIVNTGVAQSGEAIMHVTDILMVEHDWRLLPELSPWCRRYPALRFMGISSNEPSTEHYFDYRIDREAAIRDTRDAWARGVGWHCSTEHYITLPVWFQAYMGSLSSRPPSVAVVAVPEVSP